ncbi:hypothetical protein CW751_10075 [Brumimicrobium salinarum]|uniref:DUF4293 domain-containing protein n=1 Tax=Brumimicrobium salinarum TaxID=2058658 RepID=A0A2I0R1F8_9FLAO|nr:DUF4293 family protein [Brumimicrobium salinarum]PKR80407.1 hypothetical protein CW751_10075 [Brumimicrobium salinarum]
MIQRVQSIYLLLTLIALIFLSVGTDVFVTKVQQKDQFEMISHGNVYGVQKDVYIEGELSDQNLNLLRSATDRVDFVAEMEGIPTFYFPFYSITILLSMLTVVVLFGFKNLKRQLKLGRILFIMNFLVFGVTIVFYNLMRSSNMPDSADYIVNTQLGFGFYCIVIALAFSFLANIGIRRDLRLIKSIDRIR